MTSNDVGYWHKVPASASAMAMASQSEPQSSEVVVYQMPVHSQQGGIVITPAMALGAVLLLGVITGMVIMLTLDKYKK